MTPESQSCPRCGFANSDVSSSSPEASPGLTPELEATLLSTNQILSEVQVEETQDTLTLVSDQIETLTQQVSRLQGLLEAASARRQRLKGLLHPIRALPDDLLLEILHHVALLPDDIASADMEKVVMPRAWTLSHVSRRWRDCVLSSGSIWSCLFANMDNEEPSERFIECLAERIQHTKSAPLEVWIHGEKDVSPDHPLLGLLLPTSSRWKRLILTVPPSFIHTGLLIPVRESFRNLSLMHIEYEWDKFDRSIIRPNRQTLSYTFEHAINTQELATYEVDECLEIGELDQLKLFTSTFYPFIRGDPILPSHMSIIRKAPRLRVLWLGVDEYEPLGDEDPDKPVVLPFVETLKLLNLALSKNALRATISKLRVPKLSELGFRGPVFDRKIPTKLSKVDDMNLILSMLAQSQCTVTKLVIDGVLLYDYGDWDTLFPLLRGIPTLESLDLEGPISKAVLKAFAISPEPRGQDPLAPKLKRLAHRHAVREEEEEAFVRAIESRTLDRHPSITPLVYVLYPRPIVNKGLADRLDRCADKDVEIWCKNPDLVEK